MIDTVVIEDEIEIQGFIVSLLTRYCSGLRVVGTAGSVEQATLLIKQKKPELVFLDVELKDGKAFEILEVFDENDFVTIFLTGYSKYGIEGVKYGVGDYLMKPIVLKELIQSVDKAREKVREKDVLRKFHSQDHFEKIEGRILVSKIDRSKVLLTCSEIQYLQSEQGYTRIHLVDGQSLLANSALKSICERLPSFFVRVHRSHAINLNFVRSYEVKRNGWVKLDDGEVLPVSARSKRRFLEVMNSFL